jgi:exopolyphosphatase/guanosine-5'-triphosphate,3'-diphosphate pyrophosphatase
MAMSVVRVHLEDVTRLLPAAKEARTIVGVAGTITTVAAVELGFYDRDEVHHFRLSRAAAEDVFRTLATEPLADRRTNPGLRPERADIIVGGCCILVSVLRHLDADALLVSETGILDGLARS